MNSSNKIAVLNIIALNIVLYVLADYLDWTVYGIFEIYLVESLVIAGIGLLKLFLSQKKDNPNLSNWVIKIFLAPCFAFTFYFVTLLQFMMLQSFFSLNDIGFDGSGLSLLNGMMGALFSFAGIILIFSHLASFGYSFLYKKKYLETKPSSTLSGAIIRFFMLELAIFGGAVIMFNSSKASTTIILLFVLLKTGFDLIGLYVEQRITTTR